MKSIKTIRKLQAPDGHKIPNVYVRRGAKTLVIMSHGITTDMNEDGIYKQFAEEILAPEFDSIRFDFRGHGKSKIPPHEMTVAGAILDFATVVIWAKEQKYKNIVLLSTSMGASITLLALSAFDELEFEKAVFWNPVINYRNTFTKPKAEWAQEFFNHETVFDLLQRHGTQVPETEFTIGPKLTSELLILQPQAVEWPERIPLMIVHGDHDSCVPYDDAVTYAAENKNIVLNTISGADHGFEGHLEEVFHITLDWFREQE